MKNFEASESARLMDANFAGAYRVMFHLKRRDRSVGVASVNIQIRPGLRDGDDIR